MPDAPTIFCGWIRVDGRGRWRLLVNGGDPVQVDALTRCHAERAGREYVVLPEGMEPDPRETPRPKRWKGKQDDE